MRYKKTLEIRQRVEGQIDSVYRRVVSECLPFEKWLELTNNITIDSRLPVHAKEFLRGYQTALFHNIQVNLVYWGHEVGGVIYVGWENVPEEGKERIRSGEMTGNHYWIKDGEKTEKPWGKKIIY